MKIDPSYRVVANSFFRKQWDRKRAFRSRIEAIWEDWKGASTVKGDLRAKFAADFQAALEAAGGFEFAVSGELKRTRMNSNHIHRFSNYLLLPLSIGQRRDENSAPYVEEMVMLTRVGAQITGKKVIAYQAPLCLLLSRHFMERLFDRGAAEPDIGSQLQADTLTIARKLAFALSVRLAKTETGEDRGQSAFIPYGDGLIVFVSKILAGLSTDENLGWKFDFAKQKHVPLYVKKDLIKDLARTSEARAEQRMFVHSWYAATYVGGSMLSSAQRKYAVDFEAVYDALDATDIDNSFDLWFNPDHVFRRDKPKWIELTPELAKAFEQVELSLGDDALRVHGKHPFMYILNDGSETNALRSNAK